MLAPHANDRVIREVLTDLGASFVRYLLNESIGELRLVESQFPTVKELRADLVLEDAPLNLIRHFEAQRQNEPMVGRMMMTAAALALRFPGKRIDQTVIYYGEEPCRIASELVLTQCTYRFRLIDMRTVDCRTFLEAEEPEAALLALLCHPSGMTLGELAHAVVAKVTATSGQRRLKLITGLETLVTNRRQLIPYVQEELKMALALNVEEFITYQMGVQRGIEQGVERGIAQGRLSGEQAALKTVIEARFGPLPAWVEERIARLTEEAEINAYIRAAATADSLESLFGQG